MDRKGEITQLLVSLIFFGISFHRFSKNQWSEVKNTSWTIILLIKFGTARPNHQWKMWSWATFSTLPEFALEELVLWQDCRQVLVWLFPDPGGGFCFLLPAGWSGWTWRAGGCCCCLAWTGCPQIPESCAPSLAVAAPSHFSKNQGFSSAFCFLWFLIQSEIFKKSYLSNQSCIWIKHKQ